MRTTTRFGNIVLVLVLALAMRAIAPLAHASPDAGPATGPPLAATAVALTGMSLGYGGMQLLWYVYGVSPCVYYDASSIPRGQYGIVATDPTHAAQILSGQVPAPAPVQSAWGM